MNVARQHSLSADWNKDSVLKLVGAVTWTGASKAFLNSAFEMDISSLLHFLCLVFIFRLSDTAVGFFLLTVKLSLWIFLYFG